jgi:hypothetical protein
MGLAVPAKAVNAEGVLIIVAATTAAAAIAAVVTVASVQHRRQKIVITGCVISGEKGMTVADEEDSKIYVLSGNTTDIKPGDRMRLQGQESEAEGSRQDACLGGKRSGRGLRRLSALPALEVFLLEVCKWIRTGRGSWLHSSC